jgi:hypothetical protein
MKFFQVIIFYYIGLEVNGLDASYFADDIVLVIAALDAGIVFLGAHFQEGPYRKLGLRNTSRSCAESFSPPMPESIIQSSAARGH